MLLAWSIFCNTPDHLQSKPLRLHPNGELEALSMLYFKQIEIMVVKNGNFFC